MIKFTDIIHQPEGRRLEFKAELPAKAELARSIIAFANDAGGEFYLGVQQRPSLSLKEQRGIKRDLYTCWLDKS